MRRVGSGTEGEESRYALVFHAGMLGLLEAENTTHGWTRSTGGPPVEASTVNVPPG